MVLLSTVIISPQSCASYSLPYTNLQRPQQPGNRGLAPAWTRRPRCRQALRHPGRPGVFPVPSYSVRGPGSWSRTPWFTASRYPRFPGSGSLVPCHGVPAPRYRETRILGLAEEPGVTIIPLPASPDPEPLTWNPSRVNGCLTHQPLCLLPFQAKKDRVSDGCLTPGAARCPARRATLMTGSVAV